MSNHSELDVVDKQGAVDYNQLLAFLDKASLFEIYRLTTALRNELDKPERIKKVRQQFVEGGRIDYFDKATNTLVSAIVDKKNQKTVSVTNCDDGARWDIRYHMINIASRDITFNSTGRGLTRDSVKVGDTVGFNRDGEEIIGRVMRLNQKTVTLRTSPQQRWRVAYSLLYPVIDGEHNTFTAPCELEHNE